MPKSAKKKKDKVADFSRAKLKLGKGKALANNAIDTSFKARSIALPSQSISHNKDDSEPTTRRQLSFGDLLSHLKHHNAGARKDAILGLRELFDSNWELLDSSLTPLLSALVRLIGDEDASVRKQLLSFLTWFLPRIPADDLMPHSPLLLLFTTSAQTHIFPEIRVDAIRFLDILLDCVPEAVIVGWSEAKQGHGSRVLEGYLGILNAGTKYGETDGPLEATSTSGVVLTPASKLVVLRSLSTFLRTALLAIGSESDMTSQKRNMHSPNQPLDASFMKGAFPSPDAYNTFDSLFGSASRSRRRPCVYRTWEAEVDEDGGLGDVFTQFYPQLENTSREPWTLHDLFDIRDAPDGPANTSEFTRIDFVAHLASTLHSTIIETYLDCAPSVFSPGSTPSETEVQLILAVARITRSIYHAIIQSSHNIGPIHIEHLQSITSFMTPYFPTSSRDSKVEQAYEEFNLIFCELVALLMNASDYTSSPSYHSKRRPQTQMRKGKGKAPFLIQTDRVTQYIISRLRGDASSSGIAIAITPAAYLGLLPTIWALISTPSASENPDKENELLHATLDHALKVTSKSACKRLTIEFVGRLVLLDLEPHYHGQFSPDRDPAVKAKFDLWFLHLPQVLWEIGGNNVQSVETILRVLLRVVQRRSKLTQSETLASLQSRLVPYFHIDHPSRGPVAGPFRKLATSNTADTSGAPSVRLLALDLVGTLLSLGSRHEPRGKDFDALLRAVGLAVAGEQEAQYWQHIASSFSISRE